MSLPALGTLRRFSEQINLFLEIIFVILGRPQSEETAYDTLLEKSRFDLQISAESKDHPIKTRMSMISNGKLLFLGMKSESQHKDHLKFMAIEWKEIFSGVHNKDARHLCQKKHGKPSK